MSVWKSDETLLSPLRVVFSTLFSVFHLVMKHCISCLIYYVNNHLGNLKKSVILLPLRPRLRRIKSAKDAK